MPPLSRSCCSCPCPCLCLRRCPCPAPLPATASSARRHWTAAESTAGPTVAAVHTDIDGNDCFGSRGAGHALCRCAMRCCLTAAGTEVAAVAMWCRGGRCCGANGAARCRAVWCSGSGVDTGRSGIASTHSAHKAHTAHRHRSCHRASCRVCYEVLSTEMVRGVGAASALLLHANRLRPVCRIQ